MASDKASERNQAAEDLFQIGLPALPKIFVATKDRNLDVKQRAERLLNHIIYGKSGERAFNLAGATVDVDELNKHGKFAQEFFLERLKEVDRFEKRRW